MKKKLTPILALIICLFAAGCGPALVVDSAGDEPDSNLTDGVCKTVNNDCTLRAAIMEANVSDNISRITFQNITTINPGSPLPPITNNNAQIDGAGKVNINGSAIEGNNVIGIEIQDASNVYIQGVTIRNFNWGIYVHSHAGNAKNNIIGARPTEVGDLTKRNIIIYNAIGIIIDGEQAADNTISGNFIGIGLDGSTPRPNSLAGIQISGGANNNLIGSKSGAGIPSGGNLISGNEGPGIWLLDAGQNHISGNFIGSNLAGTARVENYEGIRISHGSYENIVGYNPAGEGGMNLISGNEVFGIAISSSNNNFIAGNYIGTRITGSQSMPNTHGISIEEGAMGNTIGTDGDGINDQAEGNLISGNLQDGIHIHTGCTSNVVAGNFIGTKIDGLTVLGNGWGGIITEGDNTRIGTDGDQTSDLIEANVISGSGTTGITVFSNYNVIAGNFIGVDKAGITDIGNALVGILVYGNDNLIGTNGDGTADLDERNVVSGNGGQNQGVGISIDGNNNIVAGNLVGTDSNGSANLGNEEFGITLQNGATENLIGTDGDGISDDLEGNLISGNGSAGIALFAASSNTIAGNFIGTDSTGTAAIPNGHNNIHGLGAVHLGANSSLNIIGTNGNGQNDATEGNLISGNNQLYGIEISGPNCQNNVITGNIIGLDITGSSILGNVGGILLGIGVDNILIGTNADGLGDIHEGNMIGGNQTAGMLIAGTNIQISGNFIGTNKYGTADLGNAGPGINIVEPASDIVMGGSNQKGNTIAFNKSAGISIVGTNANNIRILNNSIHSNDKLGIDLASQTGLYDVLINDPGDVDTGPNDLMNYPVLTKATSITGFVAIKGEMVSSLPYTSFQVQFFDNESCDSPSGHGEGKTYLGSKQVFTDVNGNAPFTASLTGFVTAGHFITSTATAYGKTSEFSACVEVTAGETTYSSENDPCDQFSQEDMTLTTFDVRPESNLFYLYVKNSDPYPGSNPEDDDWEYYANLGDISASTCGFEGDDYRVYCYFSIPESYFNTIQPLKLFSNICIPPFYINDGVSILTKDPVGPGGSDEPEGCHSGLEKRDCIAAGGTYTNTCVCPRY